MKKRIVSAALGAVLATALPFGALAQGVASEIHSLQSVLDQLYTEMIPLCGQLTGVGRGLAGFAATWYIGVRVWRHIANAEPVDFYPLLRPFALGFAVLIFPAVIGLINGILQPTVSATAGMVQNSDKAIATLLEKKQEAIKKTDTWQMYVGESGTGDRDKWYAYTHPEDKSGNNEGMLESVGNSVKFATEKMAYNFRNSVKQWMSELLQVLYEAAALCINTIRTFYLIVLAILGPLVFGLAVFDGFQHTLSVWLARYINIFLWLPVANIFGAIIGKIQENMLKLDIDQVQNAGDTFFSANDTAYLIFLIIGIIGYFTVPSVANYIVFAGGGNTLASKFTVLSTSSTQSVISGSGMAVDAIGNAGSKTGDYMEKMIGGMANAGLNGGYFDDQKKDKGHQHDKLSGKQ